MKRVLKKIRDLLLLNCGLLISKPLIFRYQLPDLLKFLKLNGKGAEVGVLKGAFSEIILRRSNLFLLYSVDPWKEFDKISYWDCSNVSQEKQEAKYRIAVETLKKYGERSKIVRKTSEEGSKMFDNNSLDFVYIDANHSYEACKEDIRLWWPKIKEGGVIAGDDYGKKFGVKKAVDEFVKKNNQQLFLTFETGASWYFLKNKKLTFADRVRLCEYLIFS